MYIYNLLYSIKKMYSPTPRRYIIDNEDYEGTMGYTVEYGANHLIYTTYWVFSDDNEELLERHVSFHSLCHLYDESVAFVHSQLIDYTPLHKSKYKMMRDFIEFYEINHRNKKG